MSTPFAQIKDGAVSVLGAPYTIGGNTLTVATGTGGRFPTPTAQRPVRLTVVTAATAYTTEEILTRFVATGRTGDVFSGVSVMAGYTDQNFATEDVINLRALAEDLQETQTALNTAEDDIDTLQASVASNTSAISGKAADLAVVHNTGAENVGGVKTFTSSPLLPTPSANDNSTKGATTAYVDAGIAAAVAGLLDFKGAIDASTNPNYPAASKGDAYAVSVAGKVGGTSGTSVDIGDVVVASADNAGGTQASVGTSWFVLEHNLAGALLAANNLGDLANAATARANLGVPALVAAPTDKALVRFSGTGGQQQNSPILCGDNGEISGYRVKRRTVSGTTDTIALTDCGGVVCYTNAGAVAVTLPNNLPVDFVVAWEQLGAGQLTFSPAGGGSLNSFGGNTKSGGQYATGGLEVTANSGGSSAVYLLSGATGS